LGNDGKDGGLTRKHETGQKEGGRGIIHAIHRLEGVTKKVGGKGRKVINRERGAKVGIAVRTVAN